MAQTTDQAGKTELEVLDASLEASRDRIREHLDDKEETPRGERRAALRLIHRAGRVREELEQLLSDGEVRRGA